MTPTKPATVVAYYRVSTVSQGRSGLGLEAQQAAVERFAGQEGAAIVAAYTEVESGRKNDRPQLARALAHAKRSRAMLVVAKRDRLARDVAFIAGVMNSGVEFRAVDNPHANRLTLHILAAVAEDEARRISERTKAALAALKARGGLLGAARPECRNLDAAARLRGSQRAAAEARRLCAEAYADLAPAVAAMRERGLSLRAIAGQLNQEGHTTRRGCVWNAVQVKRLLEMGSTAV